MKEMYLLIRRMRFSIILLDSCSYITLIVICITNVVVQINTETVPKERRTFVWQRITWYKIHIAFGIQATKPPTGRYSRS